MSGGDKDWEAWIARTGELPPDFASMPSNNFLPDPLVRVEGTLQTPITTMEQWNQQRQWIRSETERWIYGSMPPAPDNLLSGGDENTARGPRDRARSAAGIWPRAPRDTSRSFIHSRRQRPVSRIPDQPAGDRRLDDLAVRRGYIACVYDATDPRFGANYDSDKFIDVYPDYDFACIARWAWAGMKSSRLFVHAAGSRCRQNRNYR